MKLIFINGIGIVSAAAKNSADLLNLAKENNFKEKIFGKNTFEISSLLLNTGKADLIICSAIELASIILSMKNKKYIPMPNLKKNILTAENLQVSNKTFDLNIDYAISNSFAFSGNSAALVVKNFEGGDIR